MSKYRYMSAAAQSITFAAENDLDNQFKVSAVRSWTDSAKNVRFIRLSFDQFRYQWVAKPNCTDKCLETRSTRTFATKINCPAPKDETERAALVAEYVAHHNNVLKALTEYQVSAGGLPPTSAEFDGIYVSG